MSTSIYRTTFVPKTARLITAPVMIQPEAVILGGVAHHAGVSAPIPPAPHPVVFVVASGSAEFATFQSSDDFLAADASVHVPIPLALGVEDASIVSQAAAWKGVLLQLRSPQCKGRNAFRGRVRSIVFGVAE